MSIRALFRGFLVDIGVSIAVPIVLEILSALGGGPQGLPSRDAYLMGSSWKRVGEKRG